MNKPRPDILTVIPWANRPELPACLRANRSWLRDAAVKVIIANCGGALAQARQAAREARLENLALLDIPAPGFNKSLAINLAVHHCASKVVLILDNDIKLSSATVLRLRAQTNDRVFATVAAVRDPRRSSGRHAYLQEISHWLELSPRTGAPILVETSRDERQGLRAGPGIVCISRRHFLAIGGMNSYLAGWGWEDIDLIVRAQLALQLRRLSIGTATHLRHRSSQPAADVLTRARTQTANMQISMTNCLSGKFRGTFARDVSHWRSRVRALRAPHYR